MPTKVVFKPAATRLFKKIPRKHRDQIAAKIDLLAKDPSAAGEEYIRNSNGVYRVREGTYRIAYVKQSGKIIIVHIGNRKEIYRVLRNAGYIR